MKLWAWTPPDPGQWNCWKSVKPTDFSSWISFFRRLARLQPIYFVCVAKSLWLSAPRCLLPAQLSAWRHGRPVGPGCGCGGSCITTSKRPLSRCCRHAHMSALSSPYPTKSTTRCVLQPDVRGLEQPSYLFVRTGRQARRAVRRGRPQPLDLEFLTDLDFLPEELLATSQIPQTFYYLSRSVRLFETHHGHLEVDEMEGLVEYTGYLHVFWVLQITTYQVRLRHGVKSSRAKPEGWRVEQVLATLRGGFKATKTAGEREVLVKETKYVFSVWSVLSCFLQHGRRMDMSEPVIPRIGLQGNRAVFSCR